jgi:hypothetical protein
LKTLTRGYQYDEDENITVYILMAFAVMAIVVMIYVGTHKSQRETPREIQSAKINQLRNNL